jgi:tripartite-type tricarboxylate transporter receptor subunit TctC
VKQTLSERKFNVKNPVTVSHALSAAMLLAASLLSSQSVVAQDFPARQASIVVPFPAGGPVDALARIVGEDLAKQWKQPVIVENKPGAGGLVGMEIVARAKPDGHTMVLQGYGVGAYPLLSKAAASFDAEKELVPLSTIATAPLVLMVSPETPARSLRELVAYAKANPGKLNMAVTANSQNQLDAVSVLGKLGVNVALIPYNGTAQSTQAILANQVQVYLGTAYGKTAQFQAGKLIPLVVTSAEPFYMVPTVPTLKASGVNFDLQYWVGLLAPGGTPKALATRIAGDIATAVRKPDVAERIKGTGYEARASTPDELAATIARDTAQAKLVAAQAGVQPQ